MFSNTVYILCIEKKGNLKSNVIKLNKNKWIEKFNIV